MTFRARPVRVEPKKWLLVKRKDMLSYGPGGVDVLELGRWLIRRSYAFWDHKWVRCDGTDGHWRGTAEAKSVEIEFLCAGCVGFAPTPAVQAIDAETLRRATALAVERSDGHSCMTQCEHERSRRLVSLAERFDRSGDADRARRMIDEALELWPQNHEALLVREHIDD